MEFVKSWNESGENLGNVISELDASIRFTGDNVDHNVETSSEAVLWSDSMQRNLKLHEHIGELENINQQQKKNSTQSLQWHI